MNDLFIGSVEDGRIFHFKLNDNRTELVLPNSLKSKIVSENERRPNNVWERFWNSYRPAGRTS